MERSTSKLFSLKIRVVMLGVKKFQPWGGVDRRTFEYKFKVYTHTHIYIYIYILTDSVTWVASYLDGKQKNQITKDFGGWDFV